MTHEAETISATETGRMTEYRGHSVTVTTAESVLTVTYAWRAEWRRTVTPDGHGTYIRIAEEPEYRYTSRAAAIEAGQDAAERAIDHYHETGTLAQGWSTIRA